MQKKTQEQFLQEAVQVHGDKYDYSLVNYINTKTPVEIVCKRCGRHIFVQPRQHIHNSCGCKYCSKAKTTEQFIEEARKAHGDKYDYSKVNYTNNRNKVEVICSKHGPFMISPHLHLRFRGCPQCAKELRAKTASNNKRKTIEQFIQEARAVHGDKYDYSKVEYKNNNTPVCIICPEHGEFWQNPSDHLHGVNCPKCVHRERLTTEEFIERAKAIHGNRYDYSKSEYVNFGTKLLVRCNVCSKEFWVTPRLHIAHGRTGCPSCFKAGKLTIEEFIERARAVHRDKYDYSKAEYTGTDNKVMIICPKHGEFLQTPYQHIMLQNGCPRCNSSKGEMAIMRYLDSHDIRYVYDKACLDFLGKLRPDFYLPDYRMIIEYDGLQHFEPVDRFDGEEGLKETQERDNIKESLCQDNNVKVLRISYIEYKDIEDILEENL